jgi:hypothetical protein
MTTGRPATHVICVKQTADPSTAGMPAISRVENGQSARHVGTARCGERRTSAHAARDAFPLMRVLLLSRYARLGPSSRIRCYQYVEYLRTQGVDVPGAPFLDDDHVR